MLRNPLADPFTLGVASGCSVGAAFLIVFGFQTVIGIWSVPLVAFITGMITLLIVFTLSRARGSMNVETLILSGVIVQAFLGCNRFVHGFVVARCRQRSDVLVDGKLKRVAAGSMSG